MKLAYCLTPNTKISSKGIIHLNIKYKNKKVKYKNKNYKTPRRKQEYIFMTLDWAMNSYT